MGLSHSQLTEFKKALESGAAQYGVEITSEAIERLLQYYHLLNIWNPRLHLVAPCSPLEFAKRHVLESMLLLSHLPQGAKVVDIGSGAGLPIIPCLASRPDLNATLIESSKKKTVFLREALSRVAASKLTKVIAERFEDVTTPEVDFVTSRALECFEDSFPRLVEWSPSPSTLLFFGGVGLRDKIGEIGMVYSEFHIPDSARRFLFVIARP